MIDHVGIRVKNYEKSRAFYEAALAPLGYTTLMSFPGVAGMGRDGKPDLWIAEGPADYWGPGTSVGAAPIHLAISAQDRAAVDAFYAAAIAAGATDHGAPGPRPMYHPGYYGAFVVDPDGNNLEAVCHRP